MALLYLEDSVNFMERQTYIPEFIKYCSEAEDYIDLSQLLDFFSMMAL